MASPHPLEVMSKDEDASSGESSNNATQIAYTMSMDKLEAHDLLLCRLVNREWNHISCKYLNDRCHLIPLRTDDCLRNFTSTIGAGIKTEDFPFSNIHMTISNLSKGSVESFATTFGASIIEYDLDLDFIGSACPSVYYATVEKVGILLKHSPQLQILRIKDENIEMDFCKFKFTELFPAILPCLSVLEIQVDQLLRQSLGTKVHFGLLHSLLKITPKLQHFIIHFIGNGFWNSQLSNLLDAMHDVPRISLLNLSIRTEDVRRGNIQSLVAIKCQIEELSLIILDHVFNPPLLLRLLYEWLEVDGQNLTKLNLVTDIASFRLPALKNLRTLELNVTKKWEADMEQEIPQKFKPEQFPRLTLIRLTNYSETYGYFSAGVFPKINSLTLAAYHEEFISDRWDQCFPNLITLELFDARPNHLLLPLNLLHFIRNLKIKFNLENTDDGEVGRYLRGDTVGTTENIPSLKRLKCLQTLEIEIVGQKTLDALVYASTSSQLGVLRYLKLLVKSNVKMALDESGFNVLLGIHDHVRTQIIQIK